MPKGDRVYDFSLRILMLAISAALIGCVVWMAWRWGQPQASPAAAVPVTQVAPKSEPVPVRESTNPSSGQQVLLAPGQVFKCESGGKITFTDRPCAATPR